MDRRDQENALIRKCGEFLALKLEEKGRAPVSNFLGTYNPEGAAATTWNPILARARELRCDQRGMSHRVDELVVQQT